ncbi:hypothetical protein NDI76_03420 [Halogeometricum sp. S1BR25-6]|uniref:PglZ domain-containing protein n=1 Tax=Halogeometricum salsisoli TaxID=2950536 RepID=A0ABU2GAE3_9EURY|nr:hypothetical protein [Halogeometricum sp. S1BR25-6]MDS0297782.1 hypothetical protein [Halogeometricum sp. S1BR25-6]
MPTFTEIAEHAKVSPVVCSLPKLASFYLDDLAVYTSLDNFHHDLYDPDYRFEEDVVIDTDEHHPDYVRLSCDEEPVSPQLNEVVDWSDREHHDRLRRELLPQSGLKDYILRNVIGETVVVLLIVDGLSYESIRTTNLPVQPVIVDGITTTEPGFKRIIYGNDNVSLYSELLHKKNFANKLGFTYWARGQEELSTDLHASMGNDIRRIRDFSEAIEYLSNNSPLTNRTYIQITRMGLDQESHNKKEAPNQEAVIENIVEDIRKLESELSKQERSYKIFATSDHGILWRTQLPDRPNVVIDDYKHQPRYVTGREKVPHSMTLTDSEGEIVSGLAYPYLARDFKHTEWGVHGGFSYYESVVPLIELASKHKDGDSK